MLKPFDIGTLGLFKEYLPNCELVGRAHELIHCADVADGAAKLVRQVSQDVLAMFVLGLKDLGAEHVDAAFLSGLHHDIALAFTLEGLASSIDREVLLSMVPEVSREKVAKSPLYNKDLVDDEVFGAALIHKHITDVPAGVKEIAIQELLGKGILGSFSAEKVLDAIWYHDGNYPIRGFAEADMLVGDRLKLFKEGKIAAEAVQRGIDKLVVYAEDDPKWLDRQRKPDTEYLKKIIGKKTGPFIQKIFGTRTYDFVVDELATHGRGISTRHSPAFWNGVDIMATVLRDAETTYRENPVELGKNNYTFMQKIDELHKRLEQIQRYRPGGAR